MLVQVQEINIFGVFIPDGLGYLESAYLSRDDSALGSYFGDDQDAAVNIN